jgi:hypothetical protein
MSTTRVRVCGMGQELAPVGAGLAVAVGLVRELFAFVFLAQEAFEDRLFILWFLKPFLDLLGGGKRALA